METEAIDSMGPSGLQDPLQLSTDELLPTVEVLIVGLDPVGPAKATVLARHGVSGDFIPRPGERREDMELGTRIRELLSSWGNVEDMIIDRKAVCRSHARTVHAFTKWLVAGFWDAPIFSGSWHGCCEHVPIQGFRYLG